MTADDSKKDPERGLRRDGKVVTLQMPAVSPKHQPQTGTSQEKAQPAQADYVPVPDDFSPHTSPGIGSEAEHGARIDDPFVNLTAMRVALDERDRVIAGLREEARRNDDQHQEALQAASEMYQEQMRMAQEKIGGLERTIAELREKEEEQQKTLLGMPSISLPQRDPADFYQRVAQEAKKNSSTADAARRSLLFRDAVNSGMPEDRAFNLIMRILQDQVLGGDIYKKIEKAGKEADEKLSALYAKEDEIKGIMAGSAEIRAQLEEARRLNTENSQAYETVRRKELDLREREIKIAELKKALEKGRGELMMTLSGFRSFYNLVQGYAARLEQAANQDIKGLAARVRNIQTEYGLEDAVIILSKPYLEKIAPENRTDYISAKDNAHAMAILRRAISRNPHERHGGRDPSSGEYSILPITNDSGITLAYFCVTGIPQRDGKVPEDISIKLQKTAESVAKQVRENDAALHFLSEKGQLGYVDSRLQRLEKELKGQ
ncbi:hypothetical protein JW898_04355 [Candidatus Woesearchaeota archaeon]|nr:hypothetical protein [Candidatus Woesearchaeota archaeon]